MNIFHLKAERCQQVKIGLFGHLNSLKHLIQIHLRYYLIANAPLTRDTDFSWEDFQRRVNDELADVLGNFLHRTFTFTTRFFEGKIPEPSNLMNMMKNLNPR